MIFEAGEIVAPYFASTEVPVIDLVGEIEVDPFDIVRYDCSTWSSPNVE